MRAHVGTHAGTLSDPCSPIEWYDSEMDSDRSFARIYDAHTQQTGRDPILEATLWAPDAYVGPTPSLSLEGQSQWPKPEDAVAPYDVVGLFPPQIGTREQEPSPHREEPSRSSSASKE